MTKILMITWLFVSGVACYLSAATHSMPCKPQQKVVMKTKAFVPLDFLK